MVVLGVMACIFYLSSQTATDSKALSNKIVEPAKQYVESATWLAPSIKNTYLRHPTTFTRKVAHFVIYSVLGLVTYLALPRRWSLKKKMGFVIGLCFIYAITDEFHQYFVPGRGPQLRDVCIDTLGSSLGLAIGCIIKK